MSALDDIQLVATDLDGTLLDALGAVPARVRRAVRTAQERGIALAYLTGRPRAEATSLLSGAGLDGYLATSNGAIIQDREGRVMDRHLLDPAEATALAGRLRAALPQVRLGVVTDGRLALDDGFPVDLATLWAPQLSGHTVAELLDTDVVKLLVAAAGTPVARLGRQVGAPAGKRFAVTWSTPRFVEVSHPMATKGVAVRRIAAAVGVPGRRVACVGDMPNDLPMFAFAGLAVAVANADSSVVRAADLVVPSNDAGGVADLLEAMICARGAG